MRGTGGAGLANEAGFRFRNGEISSGIVRFVGKLID
jgi:hypothetical protein